VNLNEALERSLSELGLDLDGDSDDFQTETVESDGNADAEEAAEAEDSVDAGDDAEDTEDEAESEDHTSDAPVVEVPAGSLIRLPDGTEVPADKAVLFQSDYTKKTQQLAEERKSLENDRETFEADRQKVAEAYEQMRGWYETRSANPTEWVKEIVQESSDPTATIARALYELANAGRLDPDFVKTFGIDAGEIAQRASQSQRDRELEELRSKVETRERTEAEQKAIQQQAQKYQSEWSDIKTTHGLEFTNADAEVEAKRELLQFALKNRISHSLKDAYDLMLVRTGRVGQPKAEPVPMPDPQVTEKKRASRAVTPKSQATGGGSKGVPRPKSTRDAALQAIEEYARNA
jgi:hypothetical protein